MLTIIDSTHSQSSSIPLLLINPWIYDFAAYDFWAKPLGLLSIAGLLRSRGYAVTVIDCLSRIETDSFEEYKTPPLTKHAGGTGKFFKQEVQKPASLQAIPRRYSRYGIPPDLFEHKLQKVTAPAAILVTSSMTYWYPGVVEAIRIAKRFFPKAPVILGGVYATLCHDHAKRFSGADIVIAGPGEQTVLDLLPQTSGQKPCASLSVDSLPYPAFDLLESLPYLCIATSRGCPLACSYCASHALYPGYRRRSPIAVVDEIQFWINEHHIEDIAFYDDALLFHAANHIVPILEEIIRRGLTCRFHTPNGLHLRFITEEIAHLLFQSGFKTLRFGLETADEKRLAITGAKTSQKGFVDAVHCLHQAGYSRNDIGAYLLAGLPGQKAAEVEASIRFVKDCGARPCLAEYSPIPGTLLWKDAVRTSPFDIAQEPLYQNNSILPCQWEEFTADDLQRLKNLSKT
ncbi:MAG TPA: radical SAM protein [Thermodesulfobacteriota bacterium]|nr:radical SAM protein [Thermodesulfobacteriota bacterium]HOC38104.1 radical SAM protein [Thermodesulfobacteriota bacterium]